MCRLKFENLQVQVLLSSDDVSLFFLTAIHKLEMELIPNISQVKALSSEPPFSRLLSGDEDSTSWD